ncbi:unnamed protein product [Parajaminaea phylloscopi]
MASGNASSAGQLKPVFNRHEAQDFLSMRWAAAQSERPQTFQSGAAAAGTQKKGAWGTVAAKKTDAIVPQNTSSFAANLAQAAGSRRGPGA